MKSESSWKPLWRDEHAGTAAGCEATGNRVYGKEGMPLREDWVELCISISSGPCGSGLDRERVRARTIFSRQKGIIGGRPTLPDCEAAQGQAGPVDADEAEEAMLDWVPFRAAGRIMADSHLEPDGIT